MKLITHEQNNVKIPEKDYVEIPEKDDVASAKMPEHPLSSIGVQTDDVQEDTKDIPEFASTVYDSIKLWINQQENKGYKLMLIILFGCMISMFWYLKMQVREFQQLSQSGSNASRSSTFNNATAMIEELPDGFVKVGKITFHPEKLLGKGCEGTFVYK